MLAVSTFLKQEAAGGIIMMGAALLALLMVNGGFAGTYGDIVNHSITFAQGSTMSLRVFTNDILMPLFFLAVGLELKREMREGFLATTRQRMLPLIAALGGIAMPALIYLFINRDAASLQHGWAIPTATDIAFAIAVLSLLGRRVPPAAKIFLLAIAIYDDLAAIVIIALFYSGGVETTALLHAGIVLLLMAWLNRRGSGAILLYLLLGAALWHYVHAAGIHTTIAGMLTGLLIPLRTGDKKNSPSPLNELLHTLHPFVTFLVLPLFAFVSSGVWLGNAGAATFGNTLPLGIAAGLFFGKQLGIFGATYAAVKLGYAALPKATGWAVLYGIAALAGIGFTMSLFIGFLAFDNAHAHDALTLGVFAGSLASALWGYSILRLALNR